jgi:hypothetical protein
MAFYGPGKNPLTEEPILWFGGGCELLPSPDPGNWPEPPLQGIEWGYMRDHPTVSKLRWGWRDPEGRQHEQSIFIPRGTWPDGLWGEIPVSSSKSINMSFLLDLRLSELTYHPDSATWSMRISAWAPLQGAPYPLGKYSQDPWPAETNVLLYAGTVEGMRLGRFPRALALLSTARRDVTPSGPLTTLGGTAYTVTIDGSMPGLAGVWDGTDGGLSSWPAPALKRWAAIDVGNTIAQAYTMMTPEQCAHYCGMMGSPFRRIGPRPPLWSEPGLPYYVAYYDEPDFDPTGSVFPDLRRYEVRLANRVGGWWGRLELPEASLWQPADVWWPLGTPRAALWPETRAWGGIPMGLSAQCPDQVTRYGLYTPTPAGDAVALYTDPTGVAWNVSLEGNEIWVKHLQHNWQTWSEPVVVDDTGAYDSVAITGNGRVLYINARRSTDEITFSFQSLDYGQTWQGPVKVGKD